ncbi:ubiquitin carboxyl-terminal hydrolase MINDY-1-like isoform X2 [Oscarella lobularis]|uniref:ubiquitin carboxyl-terminal hydrolase MINDY-1-like isoform X2 n=1 Tax=Oscarella lobularis TaxID=121494 RepID=UPI0033140208
MASDHDVTTTIPALSDIPVAQSSQIDANEPESQSENRDDATLHPNLHPNDSSETQIESETNRNDENSPTPLAAIETKSRSPTGSEILNIRGDPEGARETTTSPHRVKWILWRGQSTPIVTQNENGPCPLLAICNTLVLSHKMSLPEGTERISSDELKELLAEFTVENMRQGNENVPESQRLDFEKNCDDAMGVFDKLHTGLDINVKFSGIRDFEFTQECILFDLLDIRLYHGWLPDPQDTQIYPIVCNLSYNQLVEKIIAGQQSEAQQLSQSPGTATQTMTHAILCQEFYTSSQAQLTYHGLSELASHVDDKELCVFFRNNHFSTLHKEKGHLYLLVTDQGYLNEPSIVWEVLSNIEGDTDFVDEKFQTSTCHTSAQSYDRREEIPDGREATDYQGMSQEDQDLLIAMQLQENEQVPQPTHVDLPMGHDTSRDHELARQLQREFDEQEQAAARQQQRTPPQQRREEEEPRQERRPQAPSSKDSSCIIL